MTLFKVVLICMLLGTVAVVAAVGSEFIAERQDERATASGETSVVRAGGRPAGVWLGDAGILHDRLASSLGRFMFVDDGDHVTLRDDP